MKLIDILDKISSGNITEEDEAYDIYDNIIQKFHSGELLEQPAKLLMLNEYEWTAFAHSCGLKTIATWRKHGWPKKCYKCGTPINYTQYYWTVKNDHLKGIKCCDKNGIRFSIETELV